MALILREGFEVEALLIIVSSESAVHGDLDVGLGSSKK